MWPANLIFVPNPRSKCRAVRRLRSIIGEVDLQWRLMLANENYASLLRYSHFPLKRYASFPLAVDTNRRDTATATQIAEIRCISVGVRSI